MTCIKMQVHNQVSLQEKWLDFPIHVQGFLKLKLQDNPNNYEYDNHVDVWKSFEGMKVHSLKQIIPECKQDNFHSAFIGHYWTNTHSGHIYLRIRRPWFTGRRERLAKINPILKIVLVGNSKGTWNWSCDGILFFWKLTQHVHHCAVCTQYAATN